MFEQTTALAQMNFTSFWSHLVTSLRLTTSPGTHTCDLQDNFLMQWATDSSQEDPWTRGGPSFGWPVCCARQRGCPWPSASPLVPTYFDSCSTHDSLTRHDVFEGQLYLNFATKDPVQETNFNRSKRMNLKELWTMLPYFVPGNLLRRLRKMGLPKFPDLVIISTISICFLVTYILLNVIQVSLNWVLSTEKFD